MTDASVVIPPSPSNTTVPQPVLQNQVVYKKRHRTSKWERVNVSISGTNVVYNDPHKPSHKKSIKMLGATVDDVDEYPEYPHAFSVTPKGSSRTYYFAAMDEPSKMQILHLICELQFGNNSKDRGDSSSACLIQ